MTSRQIYDAIIIGSGVSGSYVAQELTNAGWNCLMLEAGKNFNRKTYPRNEIDANAQLYWNGGLEIDTKAQLAMLRPKVVGGGTIVNQALMDRFYPDVLADWNRETGISYFQSTEMKHWYDEAEKNVSIQKVPEKYWNRNSRIFKEGCEKCGFQWGILRRAQKDCFYEDRNDCIECLHGCRLDSKQSTPVTSLKRALEQGLELWSEFEVQNIEKDGELVKVTGSRVNQEPQTIVCKKIVMAAGSMGNVKILLSSTIGQHLPHLGRNFFTHPQNMMLARYKEPVHAHVGPFQTVRSEDERFKQQGFKLENVFAPPASFAMLFPGYGAVHQDAVGRIGHFACIEVAIRDTNPGRIQLGRRGKLRIEKSLNSEDKLRLSQGMEAISKIYNATGAEDIIPSEFLIGLHLIGGCAIGSNSKTSVVDPDFHLHGHKNIYVADSSIFPSAPGINPSLTIMALSLKASRQMIEEAA